MKEEFPIPTKKKERKKERNVRKQSIISFCTQDLFNLASFLS